MSVKIIGNMKFILGLLIPAFIVSLQIQWTGTFQEIPIRLSVSDLLLPLLFLLMIFNMSLQREEKVTPTTLMKTVTLPIWFLMFTLWFLVSITVGYFETKQLSIWAMINKFPGWCILMGYFFLGNMIAQNSYSNTRSLLKVLFISSALISVTCVITIILFGSKPASYKYFPLFLDCIDRFTGLLINPNAFGIFCAFTILLQLPCLLGNKVFSKSMHAATILPNIVSVILSQSRTAQLTLIVGSLYFLIKMVMENNKSIRMRRLFIVTFIALALATVFKSETLYQYTYQSYNQYKSLDNAVRERLETVEHAMQWWLEKPIMGIGLGSFLVKQQRMGVLQAVSLHNTPVWILSEMGLIGLLLFSWFVVKARMLILRRVRELPEDILAQGMLIIFPAFLVASLTTEIFYQRYLWFFMGLVLAQKVSLKVGVQAHPPEFKQSIKALSA